MVDYYCYTFYYHTISLLAQVHIAYNTTELLVKYFHSSHLENVHGIKRRYNTEMITIIPLPCTELSHSMSWLKKRFLRLHLYHHGG